MNLNFIKLLTVFCNLLQFETAVVAKIIIKSQAILLVKLLVKG